MQGTVLSGRGIVVNKADKNLVGVLVERQTTNKTVNKVSVLINATEKK